MSSSSSTSSTFMKSHSSSISRTSSVASSTAAPIGSKSGGGENSSLGSSLQSPSMRKMSEGASSISPSAVSLQLLQPQTPLMLRHHILNELTRAINMVLFLGVFGSLMYISLFLFGLYIKIKGSKMLFGKR